MLTVLLVRYAQLFNLVLRVNRDLWPGPVKANPCKPYWKYGIIRYVYPADWRYLAQDEFSKTEQPTGFVVEEYDEVHELSVPRRQKRRLAWSYVRTAGASFWSVSIVIAAAAAAVDCWKITREITWQTTQSLYVTYGFDHQWSRLSAIQNIYIIYIY